jgi:hypothetical protein
MTELNSTKYSRQTASALLKTGTGLVYGAIVNSHTNGTFKLWDATSATGTVICNTYTLPSGSSVVMFPAPIEFYTGLYFTLGGTLDITWLIV